MIDVEKQGAQIERKKAHEERRKIRGIKCINREKNE
jgi:hypothetical protein